MLRLAATDKEDLVPVQPSLFYYVKKAGKTNLGQIGSTENENDNSNLYLSGHFVTKKWD